jgi:hypothetical protein
MVPGELSKTKRSFEFRWHEFAAWATRCKMARWSLQIPFGPPVLPEV